MERLSRRRFLVGAGLASASVLAQGWLPERQGGDAGDLEGFQAHLQLHKKHSLGHAAWAQAWYPSRYGAKDQTGALNEVTPNKTRQAVSLITRGRVYDLQMTLVPGAPAFPPRYFQFSLIYNNVYNKLGDNDFRWSDEIIAGYLGTFTQVDCPGHAGIGERFYNGRHWRDIATPQGLKENSCEKLPPVMTRGILLDVAGAKGVSVLPDDYAIRPADLEEALRRQGNLRIMAGDVVLIHTGWMHYFSADPKRWISREPGLVLETARWLAQFRPAAVGADTWGVDLWPTKDGSAFAPHQELITKNGVLYLENVVTRDLVRDKVYEFAFVMTFLKVKGAGQTWGTFVAVR
jgi:kynurenine formamidase